MRTLNFELDKPCMTVEFKDGSTLSVLPPLKREIAEIEKCNSIESAYALCAAIISRNKSGVQLVSKQIRSIWDIDDIKDFLDGCKSFVNKIHSLSRLALPYYPGGNDNINFEIVSYWDKIVADYMNISLYEVEEMDIYDYLLIRRDAFIQLASRTEAGQKYLENAWRLTQTKPDRARLRKNFGKEGK